MTAISQHTKQQPTISIPTATVSCTQDPPTANNTTSCNPDNNNNNNNNNKLLSTTHQLSIRTFKNYHEYVQPPTSEHTDTPTGSEASGNKRPYHQSPNW
jgi:hypothetical protein